jgi:uncharacterized protein YdiU (UPF0061 family)
MEQNNLDYTNTFVSLEKYLSNIGYSDSIIVILEFWIIKWKECISNTKKSRALMAQVNPKIIPRNHLVERALRQARE